MTIHLAHRDVTFVAVSRATLPEIQRFKAAHGLEFDWVSSAGNDFNRDFHVSFDPEDRSRAPPSSIRDSRPAKSQVYYNYALTPFPNTEAPGISVFWKDDDRRGVPHLLDLRPRRRGDDGRVPDARPRAEGPRRARHLLQDGVGAAPRPLTRRSRARPAAGRAATASAA
jgi:predicted dithiol-disulfide oxidoreductase (DUF899 family)